MQTTQTSATVETVFNHDGCPVREQVWYELADLIFFTMIGPLTKLMFLINH